MALESVFGSATVVVVASAILEAALTFIAVAAVVEPKVVHLFLASESQSSCCLLVFEGWQNHSRMVVEVFTHFAFSLRRPIGQRSVVRYCANP